MKYSIYSSFGELYAARHEPENLRSIAELYWRILLVTAGIAVGAIVAVGVWEFSAVMQKIGTASEGIAPQVNVLDRAKLESTLADFNTRKSEFESAKRAKPNVADPSR